MNKFDNSVEHLGEVSEIIRQYNKQLSGSEIIGGNIFENILKYKPEFQSELLFIMYNEGFKAGSKN